ncbi:hypothetical protein CR513_46006, partial [Mucuna pruriens]
MGHRRFLERGHKFRLMKKHFDGIIEEKDALKLLSRSEILKRLDDINVTFGSNLESNIKGKKNHEEDGPNQWKKKRIFFNFSYWKDNLLHHNLDVMYIEKNVCDNVLYTLLKDDKSKDHLQTHQDLKAMGIKEDLWPNKNEKHLPLLFIMTREQRKIFLTTLKNIKTPDGYSSNIYSFIDDQNTKIFGLKSHDCYILISEIRKAIYLAEETLNFYSLYEEVESRSNRSRRVDDRTNDNETSQIIYSQLGSPIGSSSTFILPH